MTVKVTTHSGRKIKQEKYTKIFDNHPCKTL